MNQDNKRGSDDGSLMMQGEFNKKLWLLRAVLLAVNIVLFVFFIYNTRMSAYGRLQYDATIPIIGLAQTVVSFILSFLRYRALKVLSVILIITGTAVFVLNMAGVI